ncbi:immunity 49 family protein [Streptomyces sp. RerS4]|uniref:immunity 49 family protein n=1 Tax=Streptomyces sp. RerS4 TaxID=2942449 RepID=UPI00201C0DDC|nr:immunity 49 family protein [Streptomyces sp. RerS4]UQX04097.1 immunity 49 family protein [Streptomyces sp. RerS4]
MGEAVVAAAREDFANRIGSEVHSMARAGRIDAYDWLRITRQYLDGLGALSVETPDLATPEAKAILFDAAEAAAAAVSYAAYHPTSSFHVFLPYVNWGRDYEPESDGTPVSIRVDDWIDAFCLVVLADRSARHDEAFHFARTRPARADGAGAGLPEIELINGLRAYVAGDLGNEAQGVPPSRREKLAALDAALARVPVRAPAQAPVQTPGAPVQPPVRGAEAYTTALRALRALAAGERQSFDAELTGLLLAQSALDDERAAPHTLLPLLPLALAALAYRREGWHPAADSGYLPRALVTGFEAPAPRVAAYGRDRRRDAVAALAAGAVRVERPEMPLAVAGADYHVAKLFARIGAPGGDDLGGRKLSPGEWQGALTTALITGNRSDLAPLVLAGPTAHGEDRSAYASYREALHAYLSGEDPQAATDRAVADLGRIAEWGFAPPPAVLLSQLVDGDEESFNLALIDALEAHRDHYSVGDHADTSDAAVNQEILALACHARRRGWRILVDSPYLPPLLLQAAQPF